LCEAQEKKGFYNEKKHQGYFCHLKILLGAPTKMLGAPSSTLKKI